MFWCLLGLEAYGLAAEMTTSEAILVMILKSGQPCVKVLSYGDLNARSMTVICKAFAGSEAEYVYKIEGQHVKKQTFRI